MPSDPTTNLMAAAIRCGCTAADQHMMCAYPDCTCSVVPNAIKAAIAFIKRVKETNDGQ